MKLEKQELEVILDILEQLPLEPKTSIMRVGLVQEILSNSKEEESLISVKIEGNSLKLLLEFLLNEDIKLKAPIAYVHSTIISKIEVQLQDGKE